MPTPLQTLPDNARILFQGDSITSAFRKPEEKNHGFQMGNGYVYLIAAQLLGTPRFARLELINRGRDGHTLADLAQRWETDCIDLKPHALSLLAGVNNTIFAMKGGLSLSSEAFAEAYTSLLDRARCHLPDIQLVFMEPFLLPTHDVTPEWLEHLRRYQDVLPEIARDYDACYIPLQTRFEEACRIAPASHWLWDGIHPTAPGSALIANAWLEAAQTKFFGDSRSLASS